MGLNQIKVELVSHWGGDRDAANQAWASSYDAETLASKSDDDMRRVVAQIAQLGHDTPKRRLFLDFYLTVPIFVERQLDKYNVSIQQQDFQVEFQESTFGRGLITQNELSGRYRTIPERFYEAPKDVLELLVRANSSKAFSPGDFAYALTSTNDETYRQYQRHLDRLREARDAGTISSAEYKRAREVLRGLLPTATLTDMRWVLNIDAFEHVLNQRLPPEAQLECRVAAALMYRAVEKAQVAPSLVAELSRKHGWDGMVVGIEALMEDDK